MTRAATWTNSDSLVVGFGRNYAERNAPGVLDTENGGKIFVLNVTYLSTFGNAGALITLPANCIVRNVWFKVGTAWTGGTSFKFGDATDDDGWMTTTLLAQASMTAGVTLAADGAYAVATTEKPPKVFSSATDTYLTSSGTWTAGTGTFYVETFGNV